MQSSSRDHRFAYGLSIESEFALPELPVLPASESNRAPDIRIELGEPITRAQVAELVFPEAPMENVMAFDDTSCRVLFSDVARVTIKNGDSMRVEPLEGTTAAAWRLPVLGAMLALLLEQRGLFALHAGAVEMPGPGGPVACAFAGEKGQGKSTLNAALALAGYPLLSDDLVALQMDGAPLALTGFGSIKLVPDAVQAVLNCSPEELPLVAPELLNVAGMNKRHLMTPLAQQALPLRHLFLLGSHSEEESEDIVLRPLDAQHGLAMLLPHTFGVRWGELYLTGKRSTVHLRACAKIVTQCQVWELSRRRDLTLLPKTIDLLAQTVREAS